ncbi:hydroxysteroid dehydrogenase 5 [Prunus dulcis]|uniref:Hydroxysteroid dehydrogenase 5 n=1 Tax=Prunus dulcis TaxID=3755 RepID=A0A4Y1QVS3_PRUDU|nr:hydroxysteroid dehydrogenase 5 [Prunus dulcis]
MEFRAVWVWVLRHFLGTNQTMDLLNSVLNWVVPPASLVMMAFAWPALTFITGCEWLYNTFNSEPMEDKVVIITGASSGIGEGAKLVLVARRDNRLRLISENARHMGAKHVMIVAADVVKEEECRRFVNETINFYGRGTQIFGHNGSSGKHRKFRTYVLLRGSYRHHCLSPFVGYKLLGNVYPTYVALPHLRQTNGKIIVNASVESWLPLPRMSLYAAAKAALVNFYETLRLEVDHEVGITIATHGWIGSELTRGKFMVEEGAEMQWKEEREVHVTGGPVDDFARLIVAGLVEEMRMLSIQAGSQLDVPPDSSNTWRKEDFPCWHWEAYFRRVWKAFVRRLASEETSQHIRPPESPAA